MGHAQSSILENTSVESIATAAAVVFAVGLAVIHQTLPSETPKESSQPQEGKVGSSSSKKKAKAKGKAKEEEPVTEPAHTVSAIPGGFDAPKSDVESESGGGAAAAATKAPKKKSKGKKKKAGSEVATSLEASQTLSSSEAPPPPLPQVQVAPASTLR